MKTLKMKKRLPFWKAAITLLCTLVVCLVTCFLKTGVKTQTASAAGDLIEIQRYAADITVRRDRKVEVKEKITVKFLVSGLSMFYRSLPMEGAKYEDITASCEGNSEFSYYVAANPDVEGFLDINCEGNADKGNVWTYAISYVMQSNENAANTANGMHIDVIPFGFTVPLRNVTVDMHFPAKVTAEDTQVFVGYGAEEEGHPALTERYVDEGETTTLSLAIDTLEVDYNPAYDEYVADGISVKFTLADGVLDAYAKTRFFTDDMRWLALVGALIVGLAVAALFLTRKKREIVPIVNLKAPDGMDPMQMGKLLDGTADSEDITSMIYYFADKGYLEIDFSDEDDPLLIRKVDALDGMPAHQKTLFNGLFRGDGAVRVSELKHHYYEHADKATKQVPPTPMYEKRSKIGFYFGGVLGVLFATVAMFVLGRSNLGGGYTYLLGAVFAAPVAIILILAGSCENYRYKWKGAKRTVMKAAQIGIAALFTLIFVVFFGSHISTGYERLVVSLACFGATFACVPALSRTEKYCETLGQILGFKEFIVVTEEDKIKTMLEEDPELYYHVLPYAQVLGVTDEWEKKFENILIEPPQWCAGYRMTVFDYLILNRCMRHAAIVMMTRPEPKGGSFVGRSGGGGGFGGFGGGGFGGGGGGAR